MITKEQHCINKIKEFYDRTGEWPRAQEIPAISRMIQRNFGGLPSFRKKHNLGYENYTTGEYRAKIARASNFTGHSSEDGVFEYLIEKFGRVNVHREYFIFSDARNRADFCIFKEGKEWLIIDVFYPKDICSFKGCLTSKMNKYRELSRCKVVFVCTNPNISSEDINDVIKNKKIPLSANQSISTLEQFKNSMV